MYYELIYTRCGEGIDILRNGSIIKNAGFKVYSCSGQLFRDGIVDTPLLIATAQSKESYSDPSFMDDAYLYYVPDYGERILCDFHPIPFDRNATGDYSHRPGNFINQLFVGKYEDIYPFETFGNTDIWDAKLRGEGYYYENSPSILVPREDLGDTIGNISLEEIENFVSAGRREVLKSAIAFIVSQFSLPPEERKFLVVKDENSRSIELWVASIESAFSPRMASGLSFATRMDKFISANRYTVNLSGQYQSQINLQSPNQKLRYRAMIVGVDERDKQNTAAIKALPNSPYVVLDGRAKSLSVSVSTVNPYYNFVTAYDDAHEYFCRQFMQMVDDSLPSERVLRLYSAYASLSKYRSSKKLADLTSALSVLSQFNMIRTDALDKLYKEIKQELPQLLKDDAVASFKVMEWLESIAVVVGDDTAKNSFIGSICSSYSDNVYMRPQSKSTKELHDAIYRSTFESEVSSYLVSQSTIELHMDEIRAYESDDWYVFSKYICEAYNTHKEAFTESAAILLPEAIHSLYQARDVQGAIQVASLYFGSQKQAVDILLSDASRMDDNNYIGFIVQLVCRISPDSISSEDHLVKYYKQLQGLNIGKYFSFALAYKAKTFTRTYEMERFLNWVLSNKELSELDLSSTVRTIDQKILLSDKTAERLAAIVQSCKPEGVSLVNSAHLYALGALEKKRQTNEKLQQLKKCAAQGFPSVEDDDYAQRLVDKLFNNSLPDDSFAYVIGAASRSSFYSNKIAAEAVRLAGTKQDYLFTEFIEVASKSKADCLFEASVIACASIKQFDKAVNTMSKSLRSRSAQQYFEAIKREAREIHNKQTKHTIFGRLFSKESSTDSNKQR